MKSWWLRGCAAALASSAATLLAYLPALKNDFVNWDDNIYVTENRHIRSLGPTFFRWAFVESREVLWHPLSWISHAVDYAVWGPNPWGHHLTSVVLHALNTMLVCLVALALLEARGDEDPGGGRRRIVAATAAALLFGLHPLHVESVAWVTERKDVLSAFFYLLAALTYLWYLEGRGRPGDFGPARFFNRRYLLCVGLFTLALLSKPMVVTLPLVLLIVDWYPLGRLARREGAKSALLEKLPFVALSAGTILIALGPSNVGAVLQPAAASPLAKALLAVRSTTFYLEKLAWPTGLSPLYLHPRAVALSHPPYWGSLLAVSAITAGCFALAPRRKVFAAAWAAYVATLLPVLGIVQIGPHAVADRYAYLPSVAPLLLCGLACSWLWGKMSAVRRWRGALLAASVAGCVAVLGTLWWLTTRQVAVWKNGKTLWQAVVAKDPTSYIALANLGNMFFDEGDFDRAKDYYLRAAGQRVDATILNNLAICLVTEKQYDMALKYALLSVSADPRRGRSYNTVGKIHLKKMEYEKALKAFLDGLSRDPGWPLQNALSAGFTLERMGRIDEACRYYANYLQVGRGDDDFVETLRHYGELGCATRAVHR